ncbi:acid protease [Daedalea quercina L-15889]|uniref:Acid protease n=1 Tax=Daedalea quercina L-15889 TaxID=1314783 RepID=A0A165NR45_9APHY|nr:acid protease [Daedalea quercina L-15889]
MRHFSIPLLLSFLALPTELVGAIRFDVQGRRSRHLQRRASVTGTSGLTDSSDIQYYVNITLGGQDFQVEIDTGSADLYVAGNVTSSEDTGKSGGVTYAVGAVEGEIRTATMDFLGYTVENQAFLQITANGDNETAGTGLIGLGPHTGSNIQATLGNGTGDPPLDRIFQQNTSTPNYLTVLLGRSDDKYDDVPGNITIGETLSGYGNVTSQPKLNVTELKLTEETAQHWQTLLDEDGIIGPDGNVVDVTTVVSSTSNDKQLTVVFDTGYSLPQVPSDVAQAFYQSVPGAQYVDDVASLAGPAWQIPCEYEINVTFKFGGVSYPINPLDTSLDLGAKDSSGNSICYGGFQPIDAAKSDLYDMIFGMAFLRNVYMLINYGDFVDNTTSRADPYVQLLSISNDSASLHSDFVSIRGSASWDPSSESTTDWVKDNLKWIIPLSVAGGLLLLGLTIGAVSMYRRRRATRYHPLSDPAPQEAHDLHLMRQGNVPTYANPWDSRY